MEGIFRISGNNSRVMQLWRSLDKGTQRARERALSLSLGADAPRVARATSAEVHEIDFTGVSVHDVAGALKLYLRKQSEPLVTFEVFELIGTYASTWSSPPPVALDLSLSLCTWLSHADADSLLYLQRATWRTISRPTSVSTTTWSTCDECLAGIKPCIGASSASWAWWP